MMMLTTMSKCLTGMHLAFLSFRSSQLHTNNLRQFRMIALTSAGGLPKSPVKQCVVKEKPTFTQKIINKLTGYSVNKEYCGLMFKRCFLENTLFVIPHFVKAYLKNQTSH